MNSHINDAYVPSPLCNNPALILDDENFGGNNCHVNSAWDEVWRGEQVDENLFPTPASNHSPSYHQASKNEVDGRKRYRKGLDNGSSQSNKCTWSESSERGGDGAVMLDKIDAKMKLIVDSHNESKELHASMLNLLKLMTINTPKHSVADGCAKLCSLPDLESGSNLFYFACTIMEDAQKRSIFCELPDDHKIGYIKYLYEDYEAHKRY